MQTHRYRPMDKREKEMNKEGKQHRLKKYAKLTGEHKIRQHSQKETHKTCLIHLSMADYGQLVQLAMRSGHTAEELVALHIERLINRDCT